MTWRDLRLRVRALLRPNHVEKELDDELSFHIEMQTRKHLAAGVKASQAHHQARAEFGSTANIGDACRDARGITFIDAFYQDVRYAVRWFFHNPTLTLTVVATIGLGLAINAAVFTILNAYFLRPDGVRDPNSLYQVVWQSPLDAENGRRFLVHHPIVWQEFQDLKRETSVFSDVLARRTRVDSRIEGQLAIGDLVSSNYFEALGVSAMAGRPLFPSDGSDPVVELSHAGWRRLFAADPNIVGRKILVSGFPCTVVGVAPADFAGLTPTPSDFWALLSLSDTLDRQPSRLGPGNPDRLELIGRLKSDVTPMAAEARLTSWVRQRQAGNKTGEGSRIQLLSKATLVPLTTQLIALLTPLVLAIGLILVIACANAASLILARNLSRRREIGIRFSLGASRARIVRQLITESLVLAGSAAVVAIFLSQFIVTVASYFLFASLPAEFAQILSVVSFGVDGRVVGFLIAAAGSTVLLFGLLPALQGTRATLMQSMHEPSNRHSHRIRNILVVVQITASVLLLTCSAVLLRTANRQSQIDLGMRTSDVLQLNVEERARRAFVEALKSAPSVRSVATVWFGNPLVSGPRPLLVTRDELATESTSGRFVSADYFDTLGIPILTGRTFTKGEEESQDVAIVTEALAQRYWSSSEVIGRTLHLARDERARYAAQEPTVSRTVRIVGVAGNVRNYSDNQTENPGVYLPIGHQVRDTTILVRVSGNPLTALKTLERTLSEIDPRGLAQIMRISGYATLATYPFKLASGISLALGALALGLTVSALYGAISFLIAQRTKEFGVRIALGATSRSLAHLLIVQSTRLIVAGLIPGLVLTFAALRVATSALGRRLAGLEGTDPVAYMASSLFVVFACLLAAAIPVFRVTRINPIETLRHE